MQNTSPRQILVEGYKPEEILQLSDKQLEAFVFTHEPLVFKIGTAQILGEFRLVPDRLVIELAQIDGGGEGVLPMLAVLAERYAINRRLSQVEWIVHAVNCATPNLKLRRLLERRGFVVERVPKIGTAYRKLEHLQLKAYTKPLKRYVYCNGNSDGHRGQTQVCCPRHRDQTPLHG